MGEAATLPCRPADTCCRGDGGARPGVPRPETPLAPLGAIPEADDDTFMEGRIPTLRTRGSAGLLADNFLDIAHFPFVHAGTFGTDEATAVAQSRWPATTGRSRSP